MSKITTCLWFDGQAEEAAKFYATVFKNVTINGKDQYGEVGQEITGGEPGSTMTVQFEIDGMPFLGLNGGPAFKFNEAVSFIIDCSGQDEVDYYWDKLTADGGEESQCGWLKDKFGVSWQVTPRELTELISSDDKAVSNYAVQQMLKMKKIVIADLKK
jgi:predicted 3-demethylubiquinone-9 3-methyltransferase (glyoxalase superfamily)